MGIKALRSCSDPVKRSFFRDCHCFLEEFLKVLNASPYATSRHLASVAPHQTCSFKETKPTPLRSSVIWCPVCRHVVGCLLWKLRLPVKSLLVDLQRRNRRVISTIKDSFCFTGWHSGFLECRVHLSKVATLVSVEIVPRVIQYPRVEISFSGSDVPEKVLISSIRAVQSYTSHSIFISEKLLTKDCLDELKANLPVGHSFAASRLLYLHSRQDLSRYLRVSFNDYYMEQVSDWRRRAGLGVFSVALPTSKLLATGDVEGVTCSSEVFQWCSGIRCSCSKIKICRVCRWVQ